MSFFADALMAIINPIVRIPPSIYYSENLVLHGGHDDDIEKRLPGILNSCLYLTVAMIICFADIDINVFRVLSLTAVSPILFYIGIRVVGHAMVAEHEKHLLYRSEPAGTRSPASSGPLAAGPPRVAATAAPPTILRQTPPVDYVYYLPAASAIILTPVPHVGFQLAIPISIIVYAFCVRLRRKLSKLISDPSAVQSDEDKREDWVIPSLAVTSAVIVALWLGIVLPADNTPINEGCKMPLLTLQQ
jgi:hypothetical protein